MAKVLLNPMELRILFELEGSDVSVRLKATYGRGSDGVEDRRGILIDLTPTQETQIKNFTKNVVVPQIKAAEGLD